LIVASSWKLWMNESGIREVRFSSVPIASMVWSLRPAC
jgi:hypothetical protein